MNPSPYHAPFTSAHGRARIVKILLIVGAVAAAISIVLETLSLVFPFAEEQELTDNPLGAAVLLVIFLLALFEFSIYVATVVFFLMWLYRVNENLRAFNPAGTIEYSGGWAVGSFFIPFVNLVVPYRAVREVWQKSGPAEEAMFAAPSPPATFPIWWTFWLLSTFSANISLRVSLNENFDESTATIISMIAGGFSILAAVFAYLVVDEIDKRQEATSETLRLGKFSQPPPPPPNLSNAVAPAPGPGNPYTG